MRCEKPYIKSPHGATKKAVILSELARGACSVWPCGKCIPCLINKSRIWTCRILLEGMVNEKKCFATFTYEDDKLPGSVLPGFCSLYPKDMRSFWKRVRKAIYPNKIKYFQVGEYGEEFGRPHYHAVIFGLDGQDEQLITEKWNKGFVEVAELNEQRARYITGYIMKGLTREKSEYQIKQLDGRRQEFMSCSNGIGGKYIDIISKVYRYKKYLDKDVVLRSVKIGKKNYPLGKYLTNRFVYANSDHRSHAEEKLSLDFAKYMDGVFDDHLEKEVFYYDHIKETNSAKINSIKKRYKLFKKRRVL